MHPGARLVHRHLATRSIAQLRWGSTMRGLHGVQAPVVTAPLRGAAHSHAAGAAARRLRVMASQLLSTSPTSSDAAARANGAPAAPAAGYRQPPPEILQIVDAPPQPSLSFSPDRSLILQLKRPPSLPPIAEIARPELKLAGVRIDAAQFSRSRMGYNTSLAVVPAGEVVPSAAAREITGYPPGSCINYVSWSPDGKRIAFTTRSAGGPSDPPRGPLTLWVADVESCAARQLLGGRGLNTVFDSYSWIDDTTIVACCIPEGMGPPPEHPPAPAGPKVQDNTAARKSQNRTYADLLKDEVDSALFEYYGSSELISVDVAGGAPPKAIAPPRLYTEVDASPDGEWLLVSWLDRPFSYAVPCGRFPARVELWRRDGTFVREVAALPLAEELPNKFDATRPGPRGISWRSDADAELAWIEAQDGGDPDVEVSPRDIVYTLPAAGAAVGAAPAELARTDMRCGGVAWCDEDLCLVYESKWATRRSRVWTAAPGRRGEAPALLFDRSYEDVYNDPGSPLSRRTKNGTYVLAKVDGKRQLLMSGSGASPDGNRPFLDLLDLETKEAQRLWQSSPPFLESTGSIMSDAGEGPITLDGLQLLLSRETAQDPPQTWIMTLAQAPGGKLEFSERRLTDYPHPHPQLRDLQKEVLRYKRDDGVDLTATLYLPPGHDPARDGPLPTILWAYPREYKSKEAAGQMRRSPHQFSSIGSQSPLLWLARGFAVLDGPTFPIVAEGDEEPNDTYVEQLTAAGRAAVEEVVRRGVADPKRVSVGGHSYGAFMTANLLAHLPDVFAAGIARSGAYNRTLTPMGFQSEQRTLWQSPGVYARMSPFMMADLITKPILLVHGDADNNPGTHTMQSERMYAALKGHGCPARLVLLPHESHSYAARESVLHCLYEQDQWLERYAGHGRVDPDYPAGGTAESDAD
ncbi:MAG: alpha/beta-hydrolase [Monoraphidium minutum]|nr:MAG: alpha/beta-hydrolase [Monoraphidium minutum]